MCVRHEKVRRSSYDRHSSKHEKYESAEVDPLASSRSMANVRCITCNKYTRRNVTVDATESPSTRQSASIMSSSIRKSSRPTTPLRRIERGSLSALSQSRQGAEDSFPLDSLDVAFAELSDSFSDFAANIQQIVELGQGISRFNESFASFLYGLNVNAFCVDFAEV